MSDKKATKKSHYVEYRFGVYSIKRPDGTILFNSGDLSDIRGAYKQITKKDLSTSDIKGKFKE